MNDATILIVDDESNIRLVCRTALESEGYLIGEARNGDMVAEHILDPAQIRRFGGDFEP